MTGTRLSSIQRRSSSSVPTSLIPSRVFIIEALKIPRIYHFLGNVGTRRGREEGPRLALRWGRVTPRAHGSRIARVESSLAQNSVGQRLARRPFLRLVQLTRFFYSAFAYRSVPPRYPDLRRATFYAASLDSKPRSLPFQLRN